MKKYKESSFQLLNNTLEVHFFSIKELIGEFDGIKLSNRDIIDIRKLRRRMTEKNALKLTKRMNSVLEKRGEKGKIKLSDLYSNEEYDERKKCDRLIKYLKQYPNSNQTYNNLLEILKNCYLSNEIYVNFELGNIFFEKINSISSMRKSMIHYEKNLFFYIENKDYEKVDVICRRITYYYHHLGETKKTPFLYYAIKEILEKLKNKTIIKLNLAVCYSKLEEYEQSLEFLKDLDKEFEKEKDYQGKIEALLQTGQCLMKLERYKEAEKLYLKMERSKDKTIIDFAKNNRAELYIYARENKKLIKMYDSIKEMAIENINEFNKFDFKERIMKLYSFTQVAYYLEKKADVLLSSKTSLLIDINKVKCIHERTEILLKAIRIADINNLDLVERIIEHITENKNFYNYEKFLYDIIDYYTKCKLEKEIRKVILKIK